MNALPLTPRRAAFIFLLTALLAACALTSPGLDDPTLTPQAAASAPAPPAEATPTEPAPTPRPSATPAPPAQAIAFVGHVSSARPGSVVALSLAGAEAAALEHGAVLDITDLDALGATDEAALRAAADRAPLLVIAAGADLAIATRAIAREYPGLNFIGVDQPATDSLANYFVIGGPGSRLDEEGFMAGMLAGLVTQQHKVGVVTAAELLEGRLYRNGFIHGLRYTCGECEIWPIEIQDPNDAAAGERAAVQLKNVQADVVFMAAGTAGEAGVGAAAAQGLWAVGVGYDHAAVTGDPLVLGSVLRRPDVILPALVTAVLRGDSPAPIPFSLAHGTLSYAEPLGPDVSPGMIGVLREALTRLTEGSLDTGVDVATGEEK